MQNILICTYDEHLLPSKGTPGSVCWDISCKEAFIIQPGKILKVGAGIKTFLPPGRGSRMYARSSLPTKTGLMVANGVAVFDSDFRGEYLMQLYNYTSEVVEISAFTRLMQLEFFPYLGGEKQFGSQIFPAIEMKVDRALYEKFVTFYPSERGVGGIGSTG